MQIIFSSDSIRNRTCVLPASSAMPQPTAPPRTGGEKKHLFFAKINLIRVANLPKYFIVTLTITKATARYCSKQQAACWYRLFAADRGTGCDLSICFVVTSRVLPATEHEINKRICEVYS